MANKILDLLTMGGTTFDMHSSWSSAQVQNITLPTANSWVQGASVTVREKGVYALVGIVTFASATTTGNTLHRLAINANGTTQVDEATTDATNVNCIKSITGFYKVTGDSDVEFAIQGLCNKAITASTRTTLAVYRLIDMGGGNP